MSEQQRVPFSMNENLNEYVFARLIEDHNIGVRASGETDFITARQGRDLRQAVSDKITNKYRDEKGHSLDFGLSNLGVRDALGIFAEVLGPKMRDEDPLKKGGSDFASQVTGYIREWSEMTGIGMTAEFLKNAQSNGVAFINCNYLPVSPFDPKYCERETVLEHGTQILYIQPNDLVVQQRDENNNFKFYENGMTLSDQNAKNIQLYEQSFIGEDGKGKAPPDVRTGSWDMRPVGQFSTDADMNGITRLRQYIPKNDFTKAAAWMRGVPEHQRMTHSMTDRSVAILETLQDEGIPYRVVPDQNPGQLKAVIGNTKMSIRLTDTRGNDGNEGMYIGRVYMDGVSMILTPSGGKTGLQRSLFQPSVEQMVGLMNYAMGRPVARIAPYVSQRGPIGSESRIPAKNGRPESRSTYMLARRGDDHLSLLAFAGTAPDMSVPKEQWRTVRTPNGPVAQPPVMSLYIKTGNNHSNSHRDFVSQDEATDFLKSAVASARENFEKRVNIDYLVSEYQEHKDDEDYIPILSGDVAIQPIQLTYWNVLRGKQELFQPYGMMSRDTQNVDEAFSALFEALNLGDDDEDADLGQDEDDVVKTEYDAFEGVDKYVGTPEENIRAHLKDNVDLMFGNFEPDAMGKRFSPSLVASFMESAHGTPRNKDNLIAAMRKLNFTGDELRGVDFETGTVKDKLLQFNPRAARPLSELAQESADAYNKGRDESEFVRPEDTYYGTVLNTIRDTLQQTACKVNDADIMIDDMGVVQYKAQLMFGSSVDSFRTVIGEIGQIFEPDADGVVETRYNGSKNKLFTPGYDAYVVPETEATKGQPLETRYRFRGMLQILCENIQSTLRYDVQNVEEPVSANMPEDVILHTGGTTTVNNTYRGLYHTGYKVSVDLLRGESLKDAYMRQMDMTSMPPDILSARFATARGMVHFPKGLVDGSSVNQEYREKMQAARMDSISVHALTNDNVRDPYELTNHANMAITAENSAGLFDSVLTGSGKNQGSIRYFVMGAGVNPDGTPHFSEIKNARAPIMATPDQQYVDYTPADRQQMAGANYMSAAGVAGSRAEAVRLGKEYEGIGVAQLTLQGLTFDDGAVISKRMADTYQVISETGKLRPLMPGDKICDMSGNKSIIAAVVDPNMPEDEAKRRGLDLALELFKKNPSLDVVQAPYSAVSRFNAAGMQHAMESPDDLVLPGEDGRVIHGGIGYMPVIITHHTAEDHTKGYDDEAVKQGKGRRVSAQQSWMLMAKGAKNLLKEVFEPNNNATLNFREYLNTLGYDMSETGEMRKGYSPHLGEERFVFQLPDRDTLANFSTKDISATFNDVVGSRGGFMELPFPLKMFAGNETSALDAEKASRDDMPMYMLPVMSAHLRSGQAFEDGVKKTHDYTNQYQTIYRSAIEYLSAKDALDNGVDDETEKQKLERQMRNCQKTAQNSFDSISEDVFVRKFESKHNIARDELMARRMPNSATAVWTPNPTLGVNQVAMPTGLAKTLGVHEGNRVLVNRDPLLRTYGMRDMEVVIDDNLHGVAVNPLIAVSFDGDFDGDSVGLWAPKTSAARQESYKLFSFEQNMLDFSRVRDNGDYALMFNDSMDVISAEAVDEERYARDVENIKKEMLSIMPEEEALSIARESATPTLRERRMQIEHAFNEVYRDDSLTDDERMRRNEALTVELSGYARDVMVPQIATEAVSYASPQEHMASLVTMVKHGAKGSMGKLMSYMKYAGFVGERDADGNLMPETVQNVGHTLATPMDIRDTEAATAIKAFGTGLAGAISIRAASMFRDAPEVNDVGGNLQNSVFESALRLTYLATQGILQAKHDPVKAQMLYGMVSSDIRNEWRGYAMERAEDDEHGMPHWKVKYEGGKPVQATPEDWVRTFMDMHTAKNGLDLGGSINKEDVEMVARVLTGNDGRIVNLEDPEVIKERSSPIDRMAYNHANVREQLNEMAENHTNVFGGRMSQYFAPEQIRRNQLVVEAGRAEAVRPLQPADTKAVGKRVTPGTSVIELHTRAAAAMPPQSVRSGSSYNPAKQMSASAAKPFDFDYGAEPVVQAEAVAEQPQASVAEPVKGDAKVVKEPPVAEKPVEPAARKSRELPDLSNLTSPDGLSAQPQ